MKSLQVVTPALKCIYNCPFCIAKAHEHNNQFQNNYQNNYQKWMNNYIDIITNDLELSYVVITGTNEPMQSVDCVLDIIMLTRKYRKDIQLEIQTRSYSPSPIYEELDVVAYSISEYKRISLIKPNGKKNRFVIILTKSFEQKSLEDIIGQLPKGVTELTFKVLQDSNGYNKKIDEWIANNKLSEEGMLKLEYEVFNYNGDLSIRYDANCMNATNRYQVFREDGNLYEDWDTLVKVR